MNQEKDPKSFKRRPIKNFFVKKELQLGYIRKIVSIVILTAAISIIVLAGVYYYKSGSGYFYFVSKDLMGDLIRQSILQTILPSLIIAEIISVIMGVLIGLVSSRKFAIPVYKIENWTDELMKGNYKSRIIFREKDEFETLCSRCNSLSERLQSQFTFTQEKLREIKQCERMEDVKIKIKEIESFSV
jgi:methyl-accepting chemotaxis protein